MSLAPTQPNSPKSAVARDRGRTILVADDDAEFRSFVVEALRREGYDVMEAADGNELLELVKRFLLLRPGAIPFVAVVSDVQMNGATGLSVLRAFRFFDNTTPFVLMTAFGSDTTEREARLRGANLMLSKPFDIDVLLGALAIHVKQHR